MIFGSGNKTFGGHNAIKLGVTLHDVHDFYAHSNYVELYVQYYQDSHDGALPDLKAVPTYHEALGHKQLADNYLG